MQFNINLIKLLLHAMLAMLLVCGVCTSHATLTSGDPGSMSRVSGAVVIKATLTSGSEDNAMTTQLLQKRWKEKTSIVASKVANYAFGQLESIRPYVDISYNKNHWFIIKFNVVLSTINVSWFISEMKRKSQIKSFHSSIGDIRWKSEIRYSVTEEPTY